jgi:hypothetical protein
MASPTVFSNTVVFNGGVSFSEAPTLPDGTIDDDAVSATANISASKLITHRTETAELAAINVEPATSQYVTLHMAQAAGTLVGFSAAMTGVLPATTGLVSVNLFRSTAGSTYVSVLSAAIGLGSDNSLLVPETGTIATSTMASGDVYAAKMTVSTTTVARGVAIAMKYSEKYA